MKSNRGVFKGILAIGTLLLGVPCLLALYWIATMPDIPALARTNPSTTALIESRRAHGVSEKSRWTWTPLSRISPHLQKAVIAAEDASFYRHGGFDWEGMRQAALDDLEQGSWRRGGSTITQQLAKNLYLSPQKSVLRKAREALLARELEHHLTKKRILELYLNVAEWGRGVYGAEAAARHHFGKPAAALTAEESALLAAILPSPRRYDPIRMTRFLKVRQQHILHRIERRGRKE